jgi:uncharacterized Zn finger protein
LIVYYWPLGQLIVGNMCSLIDGGCIRASVRGSKVMPSKLSEMTSRNFTPGLSDEARKAVKAVFDAMSTWRTEIANNSEKNLERVIDKIAVAAEALGWPEEIAETARAQMQSVSKMQLQTMDQMTAAWEEQIKSPSEPSAILSKLKSLPTLPAGNWPGAGISQMGNPLEMYMQIAQQWQKACADTMAFWMRAGKPN